MEIYDASGKAIASSVADPPPAVSVASEEFFQRQMAAKADQLYVSALIADPLDGTPKIVETRPMSKLKRWRLAEVLTRSTRVN